MKVRYLKYRPRRRTVWIDGPIITVRPETVKSIRNWLDSFSFYGCVVKNPYAVVNVTAI